MAFTCTGFTSGCSYTLPSNVPRIDIIVTAGEGGDGQDGSAGDGGEGGNGGYIKAKWEGFSSGETLTVWPGSQGGDGVNYDDEGQGYEDGYEGTCDAYCGGAGGGSAALIRGDGEVVIGAGGGGGGGAAGGDDAGTTGGPGGAGGGVPALNLPGGDGGSGSGDGDGGNGQAGGTAYISPITALDQSARGGSGVVKIYDQPTDPGQVSINDRTLTSFDLSWNSTIREAEYDIETSTDGGSTWTIQKTVSADTTSTTVGSLSANTEYDIRVVATNGAGSNAGASTTARTKGAFQFYDSGSSSFKYKPAYVYDSSTKTWVDVTAVQWYDASAGTWKDV